ncbi:hypothetical protein [Nostoc commune]|uniref:hypothetical protein n=1 Tax=Nostoc commune TaxID=1178 RepID=UPI002074A5A5|nr:hypothetical protein [Nostoc commune]
MKSHRSSLKPLGSKNRSLRSRLSWKGELVLATAPTVVILSMFALVEVLTRQRLLFASLASSAFLIYLDPQHGTNTVRTLAISQMMAAGIGFITYVLAVRFGLSVWGNRNDRHHCADDLVRCNASSSRFYILKLCLKSWQ